MSRIALAVLVLSTFPALAQPDGGTAAPSPAEQKKTLYALGASVAKSLGIFSLTPAEVAELQKGFSDQLLGKPLSVKPEDYQSKIQDLARARQAERGKAEASKGEAFLAQAGKEKGAVKTPSGLVYVEQKTGNGPSPTAADTVKVHYRGTLIDGKEFDSSYKRGQPIEFPLNGVIPCWTEGVQKMKVGGKAKLTCPSKIAYGERGAGADIPPNATLIFEVELLGIQGK